MSDYIPFELQVEIMKRLPVESLMKFRFVSKAWKSHIESNDFIASYSGQQQHLLVRYTKDSEDVLDPPVIHYISIGDDNETFPQQLPIFINLYEDFSTIGCSRGLVCFYGCFREGYGGYSVGTRMALLWNPSIDKSVAVVVPNVTNGMYRSVLGFGVCHHTSDPKIVKITCINKEEDITSITCIPRQVEVFTLSTGGWISVHGNLPRKSVIFLEGEGSKVVLDGFLYWLAIDWTSDFGHCLIISFDLASEKIREINIPETLAYNTDYTLVLSKRMDSLVVIGHNEKATNEAIHVWIMENDVQRFFTKLFTLHSHTFTIASVHGFRRDGKLIIEFAKGDGHGLLFVYDHYSKQVYPLGIKGNELSFDVHPYEESLLLLDKPPFKFYS